MIDYDVVNENVERKLMKKELSICEVDKSIAIDFIQKYHYSKVMPSINKHFLGLFCDNSLVGCLTLGFGTQPLQTINKLFPGYKTEHYYEIGKMCIDDDMPKNTGSQFISLVKKWMIKNTKKIFLYTLADGIVGKIGYVYQASNFYYGGFFWTDVYIGSDGEKIHPRSAKILLKENAEFLGKERVFWLTPDFNKVKGIRRIRGKMFRYMLPLYKKEKKILEEMGWVKNSYPKSDSLEWKEQIDKGKYIKLDEMPKFALDVVNFNYKNVNAHKKNIRGVEIFFLKER
jgi:hypothetical protein